MRTSGKKNIDLTIAEHRTGLQAGHPVDPREHGPLAEHQGFRRADAQRGIAPPLPGYTDEDAYPWVIEAFEKCLPTAEKCGVVLALENHWGLCRTPEGLLRIVNSIKSPWMGVTMDTGNFLEDPYDKLEMIAPKTTFVQAKTYYGGGVWYTLDLGLRAHRQNAPQAQLPRLTSRWNSKARKIRRSPCPKSLAVLRKALTWPGGFGK